jgi:hypothetical protein
VDVNMSIPAHSSIARWNVLTLRSGAPRTRFQNVTERKKSLEVQGTHRTPL